MNVKNVEKENGAAKITVEIAKDEFQSALDKAYAMVMSGEIKDGKTIAGILKLKALIAEGKL